MRTMIAFALVAAAAVAGCGKHDRDKAASAANNAQWIQSLTSWGDACYACNNDRTCVGKVRDTWEQNKRAMQDTGDAMTGSDAQAYQAALLKLRQCGDAAGITIWVDQR